MRAPILLACAFLLTLLALPASAQTPGHTSMLTAQVAFEKPALLAPGEGTDVYLEATRTCADRFHILPAGNVHLSVLMSTGVVVVTAPASAALPEMMCAQQTEQRVLFRLNVTARSDLQLNGTAVDETLVFKLHVDAYDPLNQPPSDAVVSALVVVKGHDEYVAYSAPETEKPVPGAGAVLLVGALAAAVWLARGK